MHLQAQSLAGCCCLLRLECCLHLLLWPTPSTSEQYQDQVAKWPSQADFQEAALRWTDFC
jgi:hypothetical protein